MARPTKYKPKYCEQLIDHMAQGLSFEAFSGEIGVDRDTIYEWANRHQEFSDAKKVGQAKSLHYWEKVGRDGLYNETIKDDDGMTVTRSINATLWIFNMKNRFKWRDKQPDEDPAPVVNQTQVTVQPSNDQWADIIRTARKKND